MKMSRRCSLNCSGRWWSSSARKVKGLAPVASLRNAAKEEVKFQASLPGAVVSAEANDSGPDSVANTTVSGMELPVSENGKPTADVRLISYNTQEDGQLEKTVCYLDTQSENCEERKDSKTHNKNLNIRDNIALSRKADKETSATQQAFMDDASSTCSYGADPQPTSPSRIISKDGRRENHSPSRVLSTGKHKNSETVRMVSGVHGNEVMSDLRLRVRGWCGHLYFDYFTASLILLNGILVGIQTDYMARKRIEKPPTVFEVLEFGFAFLFTTELGLRLYAYRLHFFTSRSSRAWNIFDFTIVAVQAVEILLTVLASGIGFNFNVLRILRLLRIVRLARALRLIGELRTIVSSIAGSLKPLFWTAVLLFMIIYVLGIFLTQSVHHKRMNLNDADSLPEELHIYWDNLALSILVLFESITGGIDWDTVCRPLIDHIGPEIGVVFCGYILFTVLAMLNVVTGVFIDSVMTNAGAAKEQETIAHVQSLFYNLDIDHSGEITWEAFERQLHQREMQQFFKTIDVDIEKARNLFELLDLDESGSVDVGEFMDGCLRIWSPAKGLDLRMILRDVNRALQVLYRLQDMCEDVDEKSGLLEDEKPFRQASSNGSAEARGRGEANRRNSRNIGTRIFANL